jgi:hypothetical protein
MQLNNSACPEFPGIYSYWRRGFGTPHVQNFWGSIVSGDVGLNMQIFRGSWCSPNCTSGGEISGTSRSFLGGFEISGNLGHPEISGVVRIEF